MAPSARPLSGYANEITLDYSMILILPLLAIIVIVTDENCILEVQKYKVETCDPGRGVGRKFGIRLRCCRKATVLGTHLGCCEIFQTVNDNHSSNVPFTDVDMSA